MFNASNRHLIRTGLGRIGRTPSRRLLPGLLGMLLVIGASGCGGGNEAGHFAVIKSPVNATWDTPPSSSIGTAGPIQFLVQASSTDPTPVANANITLTVGGSALSAVTLYKSDRSTLAGDGTQWQTTTDSHGSVLVWPVGTTIACPGTTDIKGSLSVGAIISTNSSAWSATITIKCQ